MLPNWLLGKSKSKLQEILGGGGGGTDYTAGDGIDISDGVISFDPLTTPAIDPSKVDGLDDDLAALAPKTALSNPNILHNPWFTVNQRGFTTTTQGGHTVDRWRIGVSDNTSFTATRNADGSISIDGTNVVAPQAVALIQKRTSTYINSLNGKKLTASIMLQDGTINSYVFTFDSSETRISIGLEENYEIYTKPTAGEFFCVKPMPGYSVTIKALKIEVGEISTLHLDPRPEYATELAKCQRYFQTVNGDSGPTIIAFGPGRDTTKVQFVLNMPAEFRTRPTISYQGVMTAKSADAQTLTFNSLELTHITKNHILFTANVTGAVAGTMYQLIVDTNGYIDFSAEL